MNLVWFLTIATILSTILGEFGQYPFGTTSLSISLTDILLTLTISVLLIWQIGIKKKLTAPNSFKILSLFWIVGFISLAFSGNFRGGLYLIRFIIYSSSFFLGYFLRKEKQVTLNKLSLIIITSGVLLSVLGFIQFILA